MNNSALRVDLLRMG